MNHSTTRWRFLGGFCITKSRSNNTTTFQTTVNGCTEGKQMLKLILKEMSPFSSLPSHHVPFSVLNVYWWCLTPPPTFPLLYPQRQTWPPTKGRCWSSSQQPWEASPSWSSSPFSSWSLAGKSSPLADGIKAGRFRQNAKYWNTFHSYRASIAAFHLLLIDPN